MSLVSQCGKKFSTTKSNFSIDHILNVAGSKPNSESVEVEAENGKFEWLNCTRYKPPKLPRQRKKEGIQRRKLGRNPRIPFSSSQVAFLEAKFLQSPYLSSSDVTQLASYLKLSETRVKIWFQNRRAREKRDKEAKIHMENNLESPKKNSPETEIDTPSLTERLKYFENNFNINEPKLFPASHFALLRQFNLTPIKSYFQIFTPLNLKDQELCNSK